MLSRLQLLSLVIFCGDNKNKLRALVSVQSNTSEAVTNLLELVQTHIDSSASAEQIEAATSGATAMMAMASAESVSILIPGDDNFPKRLLSIPDAPVLLFAKGNLSLLNNQDSVAVVGTRTPSNIGAQISYTIGKYLSQNNYVVVSGLAEGCDARAHSGSLAGNSGTIAVLAHGLDTIYPAKNIGLSKAILQKGGCLLSEYPIGVKAKPYYFTQRNRLQSGLSRSVIVVECNETSGTMHTVEHARKQIRTIGVVSLADYALTLQQPNDSSATGNTKLIQDNVSLIKCNSDIVSLEQKKSRSLTYYFSAPPSSSTTSEKPVKKRRFAEVDSIENKTSSEGDATSDFDRSSSHGK
jgi:DNA processing protein